MYYFYMSTFQLCNYIDSIVLLLFVSVPFCYLHSTNGIQLIVFSLVTKIQGFFVPGITPLHDAASNGFLEVVRLLVCDI